MKKIAAVILAAGRGTRMKSNLPKVLHKLHSRPMLWFMLDSLESSGITKKVLVVSKKDHLVKKAFKNLNTVIQKNPLGSGDALRETKNYFSGFSGNILVACGDTPLISKNTIKALVRKHEKENPSCTMLTAHVSDPTSYGRILRDDSGEVAKIVEEKDLTVYEKAIDEINVGCYIFNAKDLFSYIEKVKINQKKKEYYLTDIIDILKKNNKRVLSITSSNPEEALGINSRVDLSEADGIIKTRVLNSLMENGVTVVDPVSTYVDMEAKIDKDTIIYPNTIIEKNVKVGKSCSLGPFARLREGTEIKDNVTVGNFVELVRTSVLSGTKIKHLTYLGDAKVGKNVNIGAGTITANYDGKNKNTTIIEDEASIGVGSVIIAPVKIGKSATVGAGSVVTKNKNVPPNKTVAGVPAKIIKD